MQRANIVSHEADCDCAPPCELPDLDGAAAARVPQPGPTEAPRRNVSPMALLKDRNEQLTRTNLDQAEEIAALKAREGDGSLFDLRNDSADDIAKTIVGNVSIYKARAIQHALGQAIASAPKPKRPAG